jgi:hypothetical protein
MVAHDDALGEGLVHGHGEPPAQLGEPHQQETQAVVGICLA